jgi:hypothetical protein
MVDIQNNKSNTAIPVDAIVVGTLACFLGWALAIRGGCCKAKLNVAASCCIILAGATSLVHTFDIEYYEQKILLSGSWIICSLPSLF